MSTEQHIDPEVIRAGITADISENLVPRSPWERMEAIIRAADEKRGIRVEAVAPDPRSLTQFDPEWRYVSDWQHGFGPGELAQAVPERQEYAYRVCWDAGFVTSTLPMGLAKAEQFASELSFPTWVERALLGTWEKV